MVFDLVSYFKIGQLSVDIEAVFGGAWSSSSIPGACGYIASGEHTSPYSHRDHKPSSSVPGASGHSTKHVAPVADTEVPPATGATSRAPVSPAQAATLPQPSRLRSVLPMLLEATPVASLHQVKIMGAKNQSTSICALSWTSRAQ